MLKLVEVKETQAHIGSLKRVGEPFLRKGSPKQLHPLVLLQPAFAHQQGKSRNRTRSAWPLKVFATHLCMHNRKVREPVCMSSSVSKWLVTWLLRISPVLFCAVMWGADNRGAANNESKVGKRLDAAASVLKDLMASPDKAIPVQVLAQAKCIVIMPSVVKVALGIGARHGKGVATCRIAGGWSAPAPVVLGGGGIGLQIGGQTADLILIVMDQGALDRLLASKFKIGANISGKPGPVGLDVRSDNDWKNSEILSYSKSRGAFAGVDLSGASLKQDKDATVELYSRYIPFASVLEGKVPPTANSTNFLATVRKYTHE